MIAAYFLLGFYKSVQAVVFILSREEIIIRVNNAGDIAVSVSYVRKLIKRLAVGIGYHIARNICAGILDFGYRLSV